MFLSHKQLKDVVKIPLSRHAAFQKINKVPRAYSLDAYFSLNLMSYEPIQQVYSCELDYNYSNFDLPSFAKCVAAPCEVETFSLPEIKTKKRMFLELAIENKYYCARYNKWLLWLRKQKMAIYKKPMPGPN